VAATPFDSLEGACQYVGLLVDAVREAHEDVLADLTEARSASGGREVEALQLVAWKLERLEAHLASSRHLLNDLRRLRRVLLGESADARPDGAEPADEPTELP
jgi:hypothetical protein